MGNLPLGTKIALLVASSVVITATIALFTTRASIRSQGVDALRASMRATLLEAESVRDSVSRLNQEKAFDSEGLRKNLTPGNVRTSTFYRTIPVVSAWQAVERVAQEQGYAFRIPKKQARNPKNEPRPEELEILRRLESGVEPEYFAVDEEHNEVVFARPIRLTSDCLACHGDPVTSVKNNGKDLLGFTMENWHAGEIHGAFVLRAKLDQVDRAATASMFRTMAWVAPFTLGVIALAMGISHWKISLPMSAAMKVLEQVGAGCLTAQAPVPGQDEVGRIGRTVNTMVDSLRDSLGVVHQNERRLSGASGHLEQLSARLASSASATASQASVVAEASARVTHNVESAAAASEQMFASIKEISRSTADAARVAHEAAVMAQHTRTSVTRLDDSSREIGKVIQLITSIAGKTNLLALNATIEAAHAGAAGEGFAVVASEVKALAERTSQATREIQGRIEAIQNESGTAADEIRRIAAIVEQINQLSGVVAAAVEEQNVTTTEIGRALQEAVSGSGQISRGIGEVALAAQLTTGTATEASGAAKDLSSMAGSLRAVVGRFQLS